MFKICEICKKVPATVHLTDIKNNVKTEIHMCESCAAKKGIDIKKPLTLQQLFGAAKSGTAAKIPFPSPQTTNTVCPHCGISWAEFQSQGRLGCALDYEVFAKELQPLLQELHANSGHHIGKRPRPTPLTAAQLEKRECQRQLREAVAREDYLEAARLRDRISAMNA